MHRPGDELVVVDDARRSFSVRTDDVARATVRTLDAIVRDTARDAKSRLALSPTGCLD